MMVTSYYVFFLILKMPIKRNKKELRLVCFKLRELITVQISRS